MGGARIPAPVSKTIARLGAAQVQEHIQNGVLQSDVDVLDCIWGVASMASLTVANTQPDVKADPDLVFLAQADILRAYSVTLSRLADVAEQTARKPAPAHAVN